MGEYYYHVVWCYYNVAEDKVFKAEKRYSQKEFKKLLNTLVSKAVKELVEEMEKKPDKYAGKYIGCGDIIEKVFNLLEKEGFKLVKYTAYFILNGPEIILPEDLEYMCEDVKIDKQLLEKIADHNKHIYYK